MGSAINERIAGRLRIIVTPGTRPCRLPPTRTNSRTPACAFSCLEGAVPSGGHRPGRTARQRPPDGYRLYASSARPRRYRCTSTSQAIADPSRIMNPAKVVVNDWAIPCATICGEISLARLIAVSAL